MIVRAKRKTNFTIMSNAGLNDERLSFKAKGVLAYLLSKPDNWKTNDRHLATASSDGRAAVQSALKELEEHHYLLRRKYQNDKGLWQWESYIFDEPVDEETVARFSDHGLSDLGKPSHIISTEVIKTEEEEPLPPPGISLDTGYADVVKYYHSNIGIIAERMSEMLKDSYDEYGAEWIKDAIDESVKYNKRSWAYIEKILQRWAREGRAPVLTVNGAQPVEIKQGEGDMWV